MKSKVIVLIISIIIAIAVICIGVYGMKKVKLDNKDNSKSSDITSSDLSESNSEESVDNEETDLSSESKSESEVPSDSENETTTEQETTINTNIDPSKPMVALTFDDGPGGDNTIKILDALKAHNAHATFFVVGYNIDGYESIMKRAVDEGNEIGNHTVSHKKLTELEDADVLNEIEVVDSKVKAATGQDRVIIRPPYGAIDDRVMQLIKDPVVLWSIDTEDWRTRDANSTIANLQENVYDGAIVLMHDIYAETADAAVAIIEWLDSQGYQMVTVSELGYYRRGGLKTGIRYGELAPN